MQYTDHLDERVEPSPGHAHALPRRQESGQRRTIDGLDLAAQRSQRPPPQLAEDIAVTPLALDPVGPELTPHHTAGGFEPVEHRNDAL